MRPKSLVVLVIVVVISAARVAAMTPLSSFAGTTVSATVPAAIQVEVPSSLPMTAITSGERAAGHDAIRVRSNATWSVGLDWLAQEPHSGAAAGATRVVVTVAAP